MVASLKQWMENKTRRRPHVETLRRIAGVIGRDFMEWMPKGPKGDSPVDEDAQIFGDVMKHLGQDLTPEGRQAIITSAKSMKAQPLPPKKK